MPFIGCVPPIKPAAAASRSRQIGVLATAATVRRSYLKDLISAFAQDCAVHSLGTPSLAELAEQKFRGEKVDVASAIAPLFAQDGAAGIDAIALGCTHYTFLLPEFEALYPEIAWFDPALAGGTADLCGDAGVCEGATEKMPRISPRGCRILRRCRSGCGRLGLRR